MQLLATLWETIRRWDETILFHVNQVWSNKLFDHLLPWLRESVFWLPVYVFFLAFVLLNFGKKGFFWVIFFILTVTFCDQLSGFFKHWVGRLRPCNDPFMMQYVRLRLEHCSGSFSFTSSHAANHFGMATFIYLTLKRVQGIRTAWLFVWALAICYAQMYVGIHYPLDILGGTIIGLASGGMLAFVFNRRFRIVFPASSASHQKTVAVGARNKI